MTHGLAILFICESRFAEPTANQDDAFLTLQVVVIVRIFS